MGQYIGATLLYELMNYSIWLAWQLLYEVSARLELWTFQMAS